MTDRKLATIRKIDSIDPIDGADAIEVATVGGWKIVVKKGEYAVGNLAVYCEIDSWIPNTVASFLTKEGKEPSEYNGVKGERLRTIRLRKQLSQGLLLPLNVLGKPEDIFSIGEGCEGADVSEELNIQKWERPVPAQLAGQVRGNFPSLVPKTDQERIQNLSREYESLKQDTWSVTEKLDGSSVTFYLDAEDQFHVCSRNLDLKEDENNSYWRVAKKHGIEDLMRRNSMQGLAIQGEMIGEGIQGNQYQTSLDFYVYDLYNTRTGEYILPIQLKATCERLNLKHVPILSEVTVLDMPMENLLTWAEGKSELNASEREGVVFKSNSIHNRSFKAISNKWLLKNGD